MAHSQFSVSLYCYFCYDLSACWSLSGTVLGTVNTRQVWSGDRGAGCLAWNQERKCYVDKAREKCEGVRTHLLWLISLPGKQKGESSRCGSKKPRTSQLPKLGGTSDSFVKG